MVNKLQTILDIRNNMQGIPLYSVSLFALPLLIKLLSIAEWLFLNLQLDENVKLRKQLVEAKEMAINVEQASYITIRFSNV